MFAEFRNRNIPARHFQARLFPRPFLVGWDWGPDLSQSIHRKHDVTVYKVAKWYILKYSIDLMIP